jgi:hypothetical protein
VVLGPEPTEAVLPVELPPPDRAVGFRAPVDSNENSSCGAACRACERFGRLVGVGVATEPRLGSCTRTGAADALGTAVRREVTLRRLRFTLSAFCGFASARIAGFGSGRSAVATQ